MVNYFCAKCGKKMEKFSKKEYSNGFLCLECYYQKNSLFNIPSKLFFFMCPDCNAYSLCKSEEFKFPKQDLGDIFNNLADGLYNSILKDYIKSKGITFSIIFDKESFFKSGENYVLSKISGELREFNLKKETEINISIKKRLCPNCVSLRGKRFSAVIQLRHFPNHKNIIENLIFIKL